MKILGSSSSFLRHLHPTRAPSGEQPTPVGVRVRSSGPSPDRVRGMGRLSAALPPKERLPPLLSTFSARSKSWFDLEDVFAATVIMGFSDTVGESKRGHNNRFVTINEHFTVIL